MHRNRLTILFLRFLKCLKQNNYLIISICDPSISWKLLDWTIMWKHKLQGPQKHEQVIFSNIGERMVFLCSHKEISGSSSLLHTSLKLNATCSTIALIFLTNFQGNPFGLSFFKFIYLPVNCFFFQRTLDNRV